MRKIICLAATMCLSSIIGVIKPMKVPSIISSSFRPIEDDSSLPIIISSSSSSKKSSSASIATNYEDYFNCQLYGPFSVGNNNIDATFEYRANISNQIIIERIRLFNSNNSVVASASKASKLYQNNALMSVTFTIPIRDYLTNQGLTLKFEILNNNNYSVLKAYSASIFPVSKPDVSYLSLKQNIYETKSLGFYGNGAQMCEAKETYDFRTIEDYLDVDYYYRLDLSTISFRYSSPFPFEYGEVYLRFEDRDNLFPYFTHDSSGYLAIPIDLIENNGLITLKFTNHFYIYKRTLQISNIYRNDFVLTNDFYLPINGKNRFNNKVLYLDINGIGKSQLEVSFLIRYLVDKSLAGVSNDGINYVGGGSK